MQKTENTEKRNADGNRPIFRIVLFVLLAFVCGEALILGLVYFEINMGIASRMLSASQYLYRMVGPMIVPLFALNLAYLAAVFGLVRACRGKHENPDLRKKTKILEIVENASPSFGFLGTCISLIMTMGRMDPSLQQSAMLKVLLDNASSAFGSTVYGIGLAIAAFLTREIFKEYMVGGGETDLSENIIDMKKIKTRH